MMDRLLEAAHRRPRLTWTVATLAALAISWRRFLSGSRTPFTSDVAQYHHPVTRELVRAWSEGRVPLWTDHVYFGFPFLADPQTAAWYPGTLLVAALGPHHGYVLFLLLHSLLACGGMTALVRSHAGGFGAGFAAGLVVALSGFFAIEAQHPGLFAILCWVPLGLWTLHRIFEQPDARRIAVAALVLAMMIFAGTLQVLFGVVIVYAFYLCALAVACAREHGGQAALRASLAAIGSQLLGMGLAAVVLLPAAAHLPLTARALGMTYAFGSMGSVHPTQLLGAFIHLAEQNMGGEVELGFGGASLFVGSLTLPLAILGVARARGSVRIGAAVAVVFCGLLVLGHFGWLHPLLYTWLPGSIGSLRGVGRAVGPATVVLALLLALGVQSLHRDDRSAHVVLAGLLAACLAIQGLVWWMSSTPVGGAAVGSALTLLAALALTWLCRENSRALRAGLVALVAFELVAVGPLDGVLERYPAKDADAIVEPMPELEGIRSASRDGRSPRVLLHDFGPRNRPLVEGFDGVGGYNPLVMLKYLDFVFLVNQERVFPRAPISFFVHGFQPWRLGTRFDAGSIRYFASVQPIDEASGLRGIESPSPTESADVHLYENERALPRAYLSQRTRRAMAPSEVERLMTGRFDPRSYTVVDREGPILQGRGGIVPIERQSEVPERLSFEVNAEGPSLLVVTDTGYPGWRAWVDGVETPVVRANLLFRGVELPAGARQVEMRFEPGTFRAGAGISIASGLAIGALLVFGPARRNATG